MVSARLARSAKGKLSARFRKKANFKNPREFNISMFLGSNINVKT